MDRPAGTGPVADAGSTRFTLLTPAGVRVTEAEALGVTSDGLTAAQQAARARLQDLLDALTNLPATLGGDVLDQPVPYTPTVLAVSASAWAAPTPPVPPEVAWPGPTLPGPVRPGTVPLNCLTLTGDQAARALAAAAGATDVTPWTDHGTRWSVAFRPLLPDEPDCAHLG